LCKLKDVYYLYLKSRQKIKAEIKTSDLLSEAEYILQNADEFLVGVESEEYSFS
jgi:hypothetical protein